MSEHEEPAGSTVISKGQRWFVSWTTDVLIYVVILNLFVEFWDEITIESFWISLLTAVLLKVFLDLLFRAEHLLSRFWELFSGSVAGWLQLITTVILLVGGKLLILYTIEQIFEGEVELGNFFAALVLVLALIAGQALMHWVYGALGPDELEDTIDAPVAAPAG